MCLNPVMGKYPCRWCVECQLRSTAEWSDRCCEEAAQYGANNCMVTLTYEKIGNTLIKKDLTDFIKRLRNFIYPQKLRYFACGEYGSKGKRPHFHIIFFGYRPKDLQFVCKKLNKRGLYVNYYGSHELYNVWRSGKNNVDYEVKRGFVSIADFDPHEVKYLCKYLSKGLIDTGENDKELTWSKIRFKEQYEGRVPPYVVMSRKPLIGFCAINIDMLANGGRYVNGKFKYIPKPYLRKLEKMYNTEPYNAVRTLEYENSQQNQKTFQYYLDIFKKARYKRN